MYFNGFKPLLKKITDIIAHRKMCSAVNTISRLQYGCGVHCFRKIHLNFSNKIFLLNTALQKS